MSDKRQNKPETGRRDAQGRLLKGSTANPGGRPRVADDVKDAFASKTPRAIERLFELMESGDEKVALRAVEVVLERSLGKVAQPMEHGGSVSINVVNPFAEPPK